MFETMSQQEARKAILDLTAEYCATFHNKKKPFLSYLLWKWLFT